MVDTLRIKDNAVQVLFFINSILLGSSYFLYSKLFFIIVVVINIILSGTYMIMTKWGDMFKSQYALMWEEK